MVKTQKTRIAALLLVLVTLFSALFIPISAAEPETSGDIGIEEIMPMAANYCNENYSYYNKNMTMRDVARANGWYLISYTDQYGYKHARIYDGDDNEIGRYDETSSYNQKPHFHIFGEDSMHYFVYYEN